MQEDLNGTVEYRNAEGELHRLDGPAVEYPSGAKAYLVNDQRHRTDGPAVERPDDTVEFWLNGERYPDEEDWRAALSESLHS